MKTGKKGYGTQASPNISQKNTDIVSNIKSKYPKPKSNPSTLPLFQPTYPPAAPQITVSQEKHEPSEDPGSGEKDSAGMQRKGNRRGKRTGQKSKC